MAGEWPQETGQRLGYDRVSLKEWEEPRLGRANQHALPPPLIAAIDIAARPVIYYRHGYEGRFIAKRGNSPCRGKSKFLSFS